MAAGKIGLLAFAAFTATSAWASDRQDFQACDGLARPGHKSDGMGAVVTVGTSPSPADVAEACTRALASPSLLPTQVLRRANLLRARAAARLEASDPTGALKDLDLTAAAAPDIEKDPFLRRSMGVSIMLLRALGEAEAGNAAAARPLAQTAASARPYSLQVQQVAANILQSLRSDKELSSSPWLAASRLDPDMGKVALVREAEIGNFAGVVALRPNVKVEWPADRLAPMALVSRDTLAQSMVSDTIISLYVAYALAATGDPIGARHDLADVRTHVAALRPLPDAKTTPAAATLTTVATSMMDALDKYVDARGRQIDARIAVAEKRPSDAIAALVAAPMPRDAATVELLTALKRSVPAENASLVPDIAPFEKDAEKARRDALPRFAPAALIAPETPRAVIDYARARPDILGALVNGAFSMGMSLLGGINRTDGFRSTNNADGTVTVEFIGNTPSAALVQEMTLLRAAEVTRAAGKAAFVIVKRNDYTRRLVTTQYGTEVGSTPTGFKTELTIRPVDTTASQQNALGAVSIIDALGPLYYEAKPPTS